MLEIREFRDAAFWTGVKSESYRKRRQVGLVQVEVGKRASWENPFVHLHGETWRSYRSGMTAAEWKSQVWPWTQQLCDHYGVFARDLAHMHKRAREARHPELRQGSLASATAGVGGGQVGAS